MTRVLFGALAVVDLFLAGYLALSYDWFTFDTHVNSDNVGAVIAMPIAWAFMAAEKFFFALFFLGIGALIYREFTGRSKDKNWATRFASLVFLVALAGISAVWVYGAGRVLYGPPPGFLIDRLIAFDGFTENTNDFFDLFGTRAYLSGSIGRYLILLLGAGYLAEKYLLASWNVRWPVPILPIAAVAWVVFAVHDGETRLKAWVDAQQWRPVNEQLSWIDAVAACEKFSDGWRLPRREELTRYLSTQPPSADAAAYAWTSTMTDSGLWAIGVDLKPRRSGRWNKGSELSRDESLCELRNSDYGYASADFFTAYRQQVCDKTTMSPYLYTPGLKPVILSNGNIAQAQPKASVICVKPSGNERVGMRARRGYEDERDYARSADFLAAIKEQCDKTPERTGGACFAFAPDLPPFEESGDEKLMRAFCELARNGEGCDRYAMYMEKHPGTEERAARYRERACKLGYRAACTAYRP